MVGIRAPAKRERARRARGQGDGWASSREQGLGHSKDRREQRRPRNQPPSCGSGRRAEAKPSWGVGETNEVGENAAGTATAKGGAGVARQWGYELTAKQVRGTFSDP
jgi:hypothetical protein